MLMITSTTFINIADCSCYSIHTPHRRDSWGTASTAGSLTVFETNFLTITTKNPFRHPVYIRCLISGRTLETERKETRPHCMLKRI